MLIEEQEQQQGDEAGAALAPDDPRRVALEAWVREMEQRGAESDAVYLGGLTKYDARLISHKTIGADEPARRAHTMHFAATPGARAAADAVAAEQDVQAKRAGAAMARKAEPVDG